MQYFIRNRLAFAFILFCLWLLWLLFKSASSVFFVIWILLIISSIVWIFLYVNASKYINQMKSWKIPMETLKCSIIKIIPLWIESREYETYVRKHIWSRYFEVKVPGVSTIYKSDIVEYEGKWIFTIKNFFAYVDRFVKVWDKVKVFVSKDRPEYYYVEDIVKNKQKNRKK